MRATDAAPRPTVKLRELAAPAEPKDQVVFVTNAVRRPGLRARVEHRRPVLAVVVR